MPVPILPISAAILPQTMVAAAGAPAGSAFQNVFTDAVRKVEAFQNNAQVSVDRFLNGEEEEIHNVALAAQRAELSFELFMQARNKVVSAYQEVMRMQV